MSLEKIKNNIRDIQDFPKKGILFRDLTTAFKNAECLRELGDVLTDMYKDKGVTKVVGIESRGFIMGSVVAVNVGAGLVLARKPGKLPAETWQESYQKEPLPKTTWCCCTTICWLRAARCWRLTIW